MLSTGEEVVGIEELCAATGVFEMLSGGVLEAAAFFEAAVGIDCFLWKNSSGNLQLVVDD